MQLSSWLAGAVQVWVGLSSVALAAPLPVVESALPVRDFSFMGTLLTVAACCRLAMSCLNYCICSPACTDWCDFAIFFVNEQHVRFASSSCMEATRVPYAGGSFSSIFNFRSKVSS